jgi:hypothetical protein
VNSFTRGLGLALVALSMLGVTGCTDNEKEAEQLSKNMGDPGPGNPNVKKAEKDDLPPPATQEEWKKRQQDPKKVMGSNYPGANKK